MSSFRSAFDFVPPVMRRAWPWLIFAVLFEEFTDWGTTAVLQKAGMDDRAMIYAVVFRILISLLLSAVNIIIISQMMMDHVKKRHNPWTKALGENFRDVLVESTRVILPVD